MFAVIKTGGKQYRVAADDVLKIEKVVGEVGDIITLGEVLAFGEGDNVTIGAPFVEGASIAVEVVEQGKSKTVIAFKKRRRQNSRRKRGHRQQLTTVRISEILTDGAKPSKAAAKKEDAAAKPAKKASKKAEAEAAAADAE
jgi:large subunit ribosomal protein L21